MQFKVGVKMPLRLDARMWVALDAIEYAWAGLVEDGNGVPEEPTITSWADSQHGTNSWHLRTGLPAGDGRAVDVRTKTLPRELVQVFYRNVQRRLTLLGFDVVLEDLNGEQEHLHVELDGRADA